MKMKWTLFPALMLLSFGTMASLSALGAPDPYTPAPRCNQVVTRTVAFSGEGARDTLEASATGPDCAKSVVTVAIRNDRGVAVAAFAMPLTWLHENIDPAKSLAPEALKALLDTYIAEAQLDVAGSTLPMWKPRDPTPGFSDGQELTSPLDRKSYEALRRSRPNMLCLGDAFDMGVCYAWNARWKKAEVILRR